MLMMTSQWLIGLVYFFAAFLLLFGLWRMSSPVTAPGGIHVAGWGMAGAVIVSFLYVFSVSEAARPHLPTNIGLALVALLLGGGAAWWSGRKAAMTAMPQMVAIYNGMGGGAAAAIAAMELFGARALDLPTLAGTLFGALIGAVSLSGSLIAWAKLDGRLDKPLRLKGLQLINAAVMLLTLAAGSWLMLAMQAADGVPGHVPWLIAGFFAGALLFGVLMTLPIGGADMPVVISIYNAFTGLAVGLEGFVLQVPAMMIAGMLVGAAGVLLTLLMANAMNRTVAHVLFARFGDQPVRKGAVITGELKPTAASDAGVAMRYAAKVIIVPGYGLAVAQGQQKLYEFVKLLQAHGVLVRFAVHPVAGRMPGQMDVLLAEAGVPYDLIFQLEDINTDFPDTDMVLVIGANDVVNPAARNDKASPIYGMPILDVDKAHHVYVVKRGEGKGYAGIQNPLFYAENCNMVYGDAQAVLVKMIEAVRGLG
ncbi:MULTISPECIES: NAD(P)(+) transhydrogenase (Re/Si-specific) subunit beta [unclassified Pseudomonas]|jgi:NAD(P) transhydrogenase subunit beta|uniref:NADP transhydrogenase subunit alpha n=1 Tax=Pseudomonas gorinensis TaxID=3240790 RepID=A0ACA7P7Q0_9PSED|nr:MULTISPECIES: NAD(P)(+) transhydrogenase (Re/Si-specific) subunit beta [unclassified Pseudomonas]AHC35844.1 NADP transhydrogenase subunit alpha [Pseudomonas sp. TKP]MBL1311858.1 NAD(P)(+) transhydrogenase (Re/Si-specific) subunit beta [Pseudomonas sp.]PMX18824.1 NAD(P) transhydrogenase subunit beta [Pseudomonas sp. MPBC4-3]PMX51307.1 NAD(P) transhydrogenase subunit beta [Pseudomonas sp. FW301-21B01]PMY06072.1 NAD(P) transhydrogenase subunit beta [Pseudomonas sp. MPR-R5A]